MPDDEKGDDTRAQCGTWINNELVSEHHDFLSPEELAEHMRMYHSRSHLDINSTITRTRSYCTFDRLLPDEVRDRIFSFLDIPSLLCAAQVSREWKRLSEGSMIWCAQYIRRWGLFVAGLTAGEEHTNELDWRGAVRTKYSLEMNWKKGRHHTCVLRGHTGWVTCVDVRSNRLVSSSYDGTLRVWNTQIGHSLRTLSSESLSPAWCVQFKDNLVMAAYSDSLVRQWDANTAQWTHRSAGYTGVVKCLQYDHEAGLLYSGSDDKTIKVFDIRSGECTRTILFSDSVGKLQTYNNMLLSVIKRESNIHWFDLRTDSLVKELQSHANAVQILS